MRRNFYQKKKPLFIMVANTSPLLSCIHTGGCGKWCFLVDFIGKVPPGATGSHFGMTGVWTGMDTGTVGRLRLRSRHYSVYHTCEG